MPPDPTSPTNPDNRPPPGLLPAVPAAGGKIDTPVVIALVVIIIGVATLITFAAIFAPPATVVFVVPLIIGLATLAVPQMLSVIQSSRAKEQAQVTHDTVNSRMGEMLELWGQLKTAQATLAAQADQRALEAAAAALAETQTTITTQSVSKLAAPVAPVGVLPTSLPDASAGPSEGAEGAADG